MAAAMEVAKGLLQELAAGNQKPRSMRSFLFVAEGEGQGASTASPFRRSLTGLRPR